MPPTVHDDIIELLGNYPGPLFPRPAGWPPEANWPPFREYKTSSGKKTLVGVGKWPPASLRSKTAPSDLLKWVEQLAHAAFIVLTEAFAEGMAAAAMRHIEARCDEKNRRIAADNDDRGNRAKIDYAQRLVNTEEEEATCAIDAIVQGDLIDPISWEGRVARLMGVSRTIKWRQRPWRMQFGDFARLALIFGMGLDQMPAPLEVIKLRDEAYARATNWILLQMRDGPLPRPSSVEEASAHLANSADASQLDGVAEEVDEQGDEQGHEIDPNLVLSAESAERKLPPLRVQRQKNELKGLVQARNRAGILAFLQKQFDRHVSELVDQGHYAALLKMAGSISPVTAETIGQARQRDYSAMTPEQLDAYEVLLDLLFILPPLDPLDDDPLE